MNKKNTPLLSLKNISKSYTLEKQKIQILNNVSFDIKSGQHVSITGISGSGKSTLLTLMALLDTVDTGAIVFNDQDITNMSEKDIALLRRKDFGFVFQSFHLIPSLTAIENVMFPLELLGVSSKKAQVQALKLLERVNLQHRKDNFPHQLSGGEKQRIAICRALIHKPKIVFADEPTGNLDDKNSTQVMQLLLELQKESKTALVIVTHEKEISDLADVKFVLKNGQIV